MRDTRAHSDQVVRKSVKKMINDAKQEINRRVRDVCHYPLWSWVRMRGKQASCRKIIVYGCLTAFTAPNLASLPLPSLYITYRTLDAKSLPVWVRCSVRSLWHLTCLISINSYHCGVNRVYGGNLALSLLIGSIRYKPLLSMSSICGCDTYRRIK